MIWYNMIWHFSILLPFLPFLPLISHPFFPASLLFFLSNLLPLFLLHLFYFFCFFYFFLLSDSQTLDETTSDGRTLLTADSEDGVRKWDFLDFNIDWLLVRSIALPLITKFTFRTNGTCLSPRYVRAYLYLYVCMYVCISYLLIHSFFLLI